MCLWTRNAAINKTDRSHFCEDHILAKKIKKVTVSAGMSNSYKDYKDVASFLDGVVRKAGTEEVTFKQSLE